MKNLLILIFLIPAFTLMATEGEGKKGGEKVTQTFKDTRVINGHSIETNKEGQMKFIIAHRFGALNTGWRDLFGLDMSTIRLGLDYGLTDNVTIGLGRSSFQKNADGYFKARLLHQTTDGSPISISWMSSATVDTREFIGPPNVEVSNDVRWTYVNQALIARKFSDRFSLQIMPTHVHKNLVATNYIEHDVFAIGGAGMFQLTKLITFKTEYYYTLPDQLSDEITNSLSLGFDIETKHHVFQLHLSNSIGMVEKFFITETRGVWEDGDIMLGFNITRDFQIKGRKYK